MSYVPCHFLWIDCRKAIANEHTMCFLFSSSDNLVWTRIIIKRNSIALQNISKMLLSELFYVYVLHLFNPKQVVLGESENQSFSILNINNICHFIRQDVLTARLDGTWSVKRKIVLFTRRLLWLLNKRAFFRKH